MDDVDGKDKAAFAAKLADLCTLFGQAYTADLARLWWRVLDDLDRGKVLAAMEQLMRTSTWMPRPAHVRHLVEPDRALEAWARVRRAVQQGSTDGLSEQERAAVKQLGGIETLGALTPVQLDAKAKTWERVYNQAGGAA